MVFKKLTDTDKEQLAIFAQEHDKKQVSTMRALIMRGASPNEAKALAAERDKARNELVDKLIKEKNQREEEEAAAAKPTKTPRGRKPKVNTDPEPVLSTYTDAPPPSPKQKRTRAKKAQEPVKQLEQESGNQITILA